LRVQFTLFTAFGEKQISRDLARGQLPDGA
jgi:hypothetical protein